MIILILFFNLLLSQEFVLQTTHNREVISFDEVGEYFLTASLDGETKIWNKDINLQFKSISYNNNYNLIKSYFLESDKVISFYGNGEIIITNFITNDILKIKLDVITIKEAEINSNNKIFIYDGTIIKVYDLVDLKNNNLKSIKIDNIEIINKITSKDEGIYAVQSNNILFIDEIGKINKVCDINFEYDKITFFDDYVISQNDRLLEIFIIENNSIKKIKQFDNISLVYSSEKELFFKNDEKLFSYDNNLRKINEVKIDNKQIKDIIGNYNELCIFETHNRWLIFQNKKVEFNSILKDDFINTFYHIDYNMNENTVILLSENKKHYFNLDNNELKSEEYIFDEELSDYSNNQYNIIKKYYDNILIHNLLELTLFDYNNNYKYENILAYNISNDKLILFNTDKILIYDFTTKDLLFEIKLDKKLNRNDIIATPILLKDNLYFAKNNELFIYNITSKNWFTGSMPSKSQCVSIVNITNDVIAFLYHNGEIQFYNIESKEYFLKLNIFKNNDWVVIDNENQFNGSKNGIDKIAMVNKNSAQKLDNIFETNLNLDIFDLKKKK